MRKFGWTAALTALAALALIVPGTVLAGDEEHAPEPAHGGEVVEVGEHAAFLELCHDDKAGMLTVHVRDHDGEPLGLKDAPRLNIKDKDGNRQVVLKALDLADGSAKTFEAADPVLKSDPIPAKLSLKIGDKQHTVDLAAEHDHDHDHDHDHK
jgi:hypothetical protein